MNEQKKLSNNLIGSAGEYFAAGELSRHGIVAALTMAGTDAFDILAINQNTGKNFSIQVKTTRKRSEGWVLSKKDETARADSLYYIFVWLPCNDKELPEYYIMPAKVVAQTIKTEYEAWLNTPGRDGKKHQATSIRVLRIEQRDQRYYGRWDYFE